MTRKTAAVLLCLLLAQAAAAQKKAGDITVLGDAADLSAASAAGGGGSLVSGGALAGFAYGSSSSGSTSLESGFYSRLVGTQSPPDYVTLTTGSFALAWTGGDPSGTIYQVLVSSWTQPDPYMVFFSTTGTGYPVETLSANTTYYSFLFANYMEGDYSALAPAAAATLAVRPSTGAFTVTDAGHNTLALSFGGFDNPPPLYGEPWTQEASGVQARYGLASVAYGSHVYVSGGFDGVYISSAVMRAALDASGLMTGWEAAGYMPAGLYGHQLAAARGRLYVIGGYSTAGSRSEVWSADISSAGVLGAWSAEPALPDPVYFHASAQAYGRIYVSGGYKSGSGVQKAVNYAAVGEDGSLGPWTYAGDMEAPRYAHTLTLAAGRLYAAGGKDGSSARAEVWAMELAADGSLSGSWTPFTSLPSPRYGHRTLAAGNRLYVVGGSNGQAAQNSVFQSTVSASVSGSAPWEAYAALPQPRQFPAAEVSGGRLWVIGGSDGGSSSGSVYSSALRGTEYRLAFSADPGMTAGVSVTGWGPSPSWNIGGLEPGTPYYFEASARNWAGTETAYSDTGSTATYAALPGTAPWSSVGIYSAQANWQQNGSPSAGYSFDLVYSSFSDYSYPSASNTALLYASLSGLQASTTYYAKVRMVDALGRRSRYAELPPVRTAYDPVLDVSSPTITDSQADFAGWLSTNTFLCDVGFADPPGSGLATLEARSATEAGASPASPTPWVTVLGPIGSDSYSGGWRLPQALWELMPEGASNYISIRVTDNVGNSTTTADLFSLVKDVTPPAITSSYVSPAGWLADYPGDASGLHFEDALSGLARLQYSVSASKGYADGAVIPWTDVAGFTVGSSSQDVTIAYNFNQLANAASNYFSLRAVDVAGSTRTLVDAFGVGKSVSGPTVLISTPSGGYLSSFAEVSGNTFETNSHAVRGTEVSLKDLSSGLYYDGSGFLAGSRVWHDAEDAPGTFTITFPSLPLVSGRQYQVVARSSDAAGDYSQVYDTRTITFDSLPPAVGIMNPADGYPAASPSAVSGTASDPVSGITSVDVRLRRVSDGKWWNNAVSSWSDSPAQLQAGTTPYWTWNFSAYLRDSLADGASYYVTARASDGSSPGNTGEFGVYGSTFGYRDVTPPPATLTLSAARGSFSGAVDLYWRTAGDNAASGYLLSGGYRIAYSTYTGAAVSTSSAQVSIATATLTAGSTQHSLVTGLDPSVTYYFTLWTADDVPNWSAASNEASGESGAPESGSVSGKVTDGSGQPVTGVLVQALGPTGAVEGSDYTDAYGAYSLPGLDPLYLTIRAVWTAEDIESSVSKDGVANGSSGVDFSLSVSYQLASVVGYIPANYLRAARRSSGARYTTRETPASSGEAFLEVYSRGRRIGAAYAGSDGSFTVPNLLPGTYSLRVFNGRDYSRTSTVKLVSGQRLVFLPEWDLLVKDQVYAYPNPAGAVVNIRFSPSAASFEARADVFDVAGRLVKTMTTPEADPVAGGSRFVWQLARDGTAPGVYIYVLRIRDSSTGAEEKVIKKLAVIR